jgi:oxygen-independent coproporphyrinogen-3 oxidase
MKLRIKEIEKHHGSIQTIYFGGGTPSVLTKEHLIRIFSSLNEYFDLSHTEECTIEANPEDINEDKIEIWQELGINRLSLGIQSFDKSKLKSINRSHDHHQARYALETIKKSTISNYTADLIFGIPPFNLNSWKEELEELVSYEVPHLSIYGLTVEPKTVFGNWAKKGKFRQTNEDLMAETFRTTHETLTCKNFDHYEVSNYGKKGFHSKHNSSYWAGKNYIGFGPGAHSFDGDTRSFVIPHNANYIKSLQSGKVPLTKETLTVCDKINETIFTQLRTSKGLDLAKLKNEMKADLHLDYAEEIKKWEQQGLVYISGHHMMLTLDGMLLADEISSKMFYG